MRKVRFARFVDETRKSYYAKSWNRSQSFTRDTFAKFHGYSMGYGRFQPNVKRNEALYQHWQAGHTIQETTDLTGIPKSTVWYFFKKFERYASQGKPIPIGGRRGKLTSSSSLKELEYMSLLHRDLIRKKVEGLVKANRIDEAHKLLEIEAMEKQLRLNTEQFVEDIRRYRNSHGEPEDFLYGEGGQSLPHPLSKRRNHIPAHELDLPSVQD